MSDPRLHHDESRARSGAAPGNTSSPLEALFANLRHQQNSASSGNRSSTSAMLSQISNQPSASQPDLTLAHQSSQAPVPEPYNPPRRAQSEYLSSLSGANVTTTPTRASNPDRASNLLNLLKFGTAKPEPPAQPQQLGLEADPVNASPAAADSSTPHGRSISANDLVASFMGKPSPLRSDVSPLLSTPANPIDLSRAVSDPHPSPSPQTQDYLLKLLSRAKAPTVQAEPPALSVAPPEPLRNHLARELADTSLEARRTSGMSTVEADAPTVTKPTADAAPPASHRERSNDEAEPASVPKGQVVSNEASQTIFTYVNPFDQLAASSPRNRTPKAQTPRPAESRSATPKFEILRPPRNGSPAAVAGNDARPSVKKEAAEKVNVESSAERPAQAGDSFDDTAEGAEAARGGNAIAETVADALEHVGEQVGQEVEEALARAEEDLDAATQSLPDRSRATGESEVGQVLTDAAVAIKAELDKEENEGALEEILPEPVAGAVRDVVDEAAQGQIADGWVSADGEDGPDTGDEARNVRVYNFPMRPFVSLHLKPSPETALPLRDEQVMDIARLKKEFDQLDRNLATASEDYIVYAMSKHGGVRLIRQDDGRDKQVFSSTKDRVFNVALSTAASGTPSAGTEAVLATGMSGSVYWFNVSHGDVDLWNDDVAESHGFVLPPQAAQEDNPSGGQLKTRAKISSRHPEFFAVGRGKAIHIVWPSVASAPRYLSTQSRVVDTERYLHERCLKIVTGKAGKDFAFSEDDSAIASLDKLGRLRLWDVRDLVDGSNGLVEDGNFQLEPVEIKTPLMTLLTSATAEKAWPSSVLFVDKTRPYARGTAQRYLIVGLKQNHTLQLWDLALGRAVQELHLPHEQETDGICSIAYHHPTGIIAIGHPTRNSIYLVHLSAPRYNLSPVAQARFVERLARRDPSLPAPEATAIMSGVREISFAKKGQLRSLDILPKSGSTVEDPEDPLLFELYVMHSRGVSSISIKRRDLGWSKDGRVLHPVDAEADGLLEVLELREVPQNATFETPVNGERASGAAGTGAGAAAAEQEGQEGSAPGRARPATSRSLESSEKPSDTPATREPAPRPPPSNGSGENGVGEAGKKKKKRVGERDSSVTPTAALRSTLASVAGGANSQQDRNKERSESPAKGNGTRSRATEASSIVEPGSGELLNKEIKKMEQTVVTEFNKVTSKELDSLYRRLDEDKRIQQASGDAKQEAILRLVSSTLSENVEKSLARMIDQNMQRLVLPTIAEVTTSSLQRILSEVLRQQLHHGVWQDVRKALPESVARTMQSPEVLRVMMDVVGSQVAVHVERELATLLHRIISPALAELTTTTAQKVAAEVEARALHQARKADIQRQQDSARVEQLQEVVRNLNQTVVKMAEAQAEFQDEILRLQRQSTQGRPPSPQRAPAPTSGREASRATSAVFQPSPPAVARPERPEQKELDSITALMREGRYEDATIQWLQSEHQTELFEGFFAQVGPSYTQSLSPLVLLSVAATVSSNLRSKVKERLAWLEACFASIRPSDDDVHEVLPRIMEVLVQRLEGLYMSMAESNIQDPALRKIPLLTRMARELKAAV